MTRRRRKTNDSSGNCQQRITSEGTYALLGGYWVGPLEREPTEIFRRELREWAAGNRPGTWIPEGCRQKA